MSVGGNEAGGTPFVDELVGEGVFQLGRLRAFRFAFREVVRTEEVVGRVRKGS